MKYIKGTHNDKELKWIDNELKSNGINDYRFCIENDCYVCDKVGNFYSVCRTYTSRKGNLIKQYRVVKLNGSISDGYKTYRVTLEDGKKHLKAHRMMLNAWIGEQPNLVVNHIDGNKLNNELSNLEWCTVKDNNIHAFKNGLNYYHKPKYGKYSIPVWEWSTIYYLYKFGNYSQRKLAKMYKTNRDSLKMVINKFDKLYQEALNEQSRNSR